MHNTAAFIIFISCSVYLGILHRFTWLSPRSVYLTALRLSLLLLGVSTFFGSTNASLLLSAY